MDERQEMHDTWREVTLERADREDARLPYPWCRDPEGCKNRGNCPRDPNCGD